MRRTFGGIRKLPSGRYQSTYTHQGKRYSQTFPFKADASAYLSLAQTRIMGGDWIDPQGARMFVSELAERWLAHGGKRPSTVTRDEVILRLHVLPTLGLGTIGSVTPAQIQSLVDSWRGSPSTIARQYSTLRAMFSFAVASDLIRRSPCRGIRLPQVQLTERPEIDPKALEGLSEALGSDYAPMLWLGVVGGLRWAEVAGLTVSSLDLLRGTVTVSHQLDRDGTLAAPKTQAGTRTLAIPAWLVDDLAALLARKKLSASNGSAFVFTSPQGGPLDYSRWRQRVWLPACKRAGVTLRFHDLRSWAASALVLSGVDVKTAQARLGHSSPQVTLGIYARAQSDADRAAAEKIGGVFKSANARSTHGEP